MPDLTSQDLDQRLAHFMTRSMDRDFQDSDSETIVLGLTHAEASIQEKAVVAFGFLPYHLVLKVLEHYSQFSVRVKWLLIPMMGALDFYQPFDLLLREYIYSKSQSFVDALYYVLCQVDYPVLPLLMAYFYSEDLDVLTRAKRLLRGLGLEKCRLYLVITPVILHEPIFGRFGDDLIDQVLADKH